MISYQLLEYQTDTRRCRFDNIGQCSCPHRAGAIALAAPTLDIYNTRGNCNASSYLLTMSPTRTHIQSKDKKYFQTRVAEVARGHRGPPPKSLDSDANFKPKHMLFCRELRFVAIHAHFEDLWAKKVPFWVKNSVSWARSALLHGIYCIFH